MAKEFKDMVFALDIGTAKVMVVAAEVMADGQLRVAMTDVTAFELGKNVATAPGKVVFQNELIQLLQFNPTTKQQFKRPLLIFPPWINKYYILDLRESNSFIKWATDQGHSVFVMSWVNPDEKLAKKSFEDYLVDAALVAVNKVCEQTGEKEINAVAYCLGGTLLGTMLAYMVAKKDKRIASATFFTTMLDFSIPGELGVPFPFNLLFWNSDSTHMPYAMHSYYLRNMYMKNLLKEPGGVTLDGVAIDLGKIKTPSYFVSTIEDHIAPWKSTYLGAQRFAGPVRFVLGGSGHIAGIVNPPAANKYGYWLNDDLAETADQWLEGATQQPGSWWTDWQQWVVAQNDQKVAARDPAKGKLGVLEDAPGSFVKFRLDTQKKS